MRRYAIILVAVLATALMARAAEFALAWDPPADGVVESYVVCYWPVTATAVVDVAHVETTATAITLTIPDDAPYAATVASVGSDGSLSTPGQVATYIPPGAPPRNVRWLRRTLEQLKREILERWLNRTE